MLFVAESRISFCRQEALVAEKQEGTNRIELTKDGLSKNCWHVYNDSEVQCTVTVSLGILVYHGSDIISSSFGVLERLCQVPCERRKTTFGTLYHSKAFIKGLSVRLPPVGTHQQME